MREEALTGLDAAERQRLMAALALIKGNLQRGWAAPATTRSGAAVMAEAAEQAKVTALRKTEWVPDKQVGGPAEPQAVAAAAGSSCAGACCWPGPLLVAAAIGWFWLSGGRYVSTDNAYVQADMVTVATDVDGLVARIEVEDNQQVEQGQVLFALDDSTYRNALASAEANVRLVRTELQALQASYAQSQAEIAKSQSDVAFYAKEQQRQADLRNRRVSAEQQLDAAQHDLDSARSELAALEQRHAGIAAQLGGDPAGADRAASALPGSGGGTGPGARDLDHTVVRASIDGMTARVPSLQPGEYLEAGQAAFALVATDHVWVEANPKESDLTYVAPGQPATVTVDTFPGSRWEGEVASLSPATQAQFSLLPAQNASGNWVKVVQRIPLRVRGRARAGEPQLAGRHERRDRGRHRPPAPPARPARLAVTGPSRAMPRRRAAARRATGRSRSA